MRVYLHLNASLLAHAHTPYNKHVTDTYAGMNGGRCGQQGLDVG